MESQGWMSSKGTSAAPNERHLWALLHNGPVLPGTHPLLRLWMSRVQMVRLYRTGNPRSDRESAPLDASGHEDLRMTFDRRNLLSSLPAQADRARSRRMLPKLNVGGSSPLGRSMQTGASHVGGLAVEDRSGSAGSRTSSKLSAGSQRDVRHYRRDQSRSGVRLRTRSH